MGLASTPGCSTSLYKIIAIVMLLKFVVLIFSWVVLVVVSFSLVRLMFIELDELNSIIDPGEASFVQGIDGGVFICLKNGMIIKAEKIVDGKR